MNVKSLFQQDFQLFDAMGMESKSKHIEAVQYLQWLCVTNGIPQESINVIECIGTGRGNELYTSKKNINEKFFAYAETLKKEPKFELAARVIQETSDGIMKKKADRLRAEIRENINHNLEDIRNLQGRMEEYFKRIADHNNKLVTMKIEKPLDMVSLVRDICAAGFFKLYRVTDYTIEFYTEPVTLTKKSKFHEGGEIRMNFGHFKVCLNPSTNDIKARPLMNNVKTLDGYHFPFFSLSDQICWGTANVSVAKALKDSNYKVVFEILQSMMTHYDDGNAPYQSLETFYSNAYRINCEDRRLDLFHHKCPSTFTTDEEFTKISDEIYLKNLGHRDTNRHNTRGSKRKDTVQSAIFNRDIEQYNHALGRDKNPDPKMIYFADRFFPKEIIDELNKAGSMFRIEPMEEGFRLYSALHANFNPTLSMSTPTPVNVTFEIAEEENSDDDTEEGYDFLDDDEHAEDCDCDDCEEARGN